jgi:Na+-driven multidrug efflux pump
MATINSVITIVGMPIIGISQGAQPIIGYNYGAKNYDRAANTFKIAASAATIGLLGGWLIVQLVPEPIVSMFNSDANLVSISIDGIRKYLSMMPLIGVSMIGSNYFQAIGKAKQAMFLSLLRQVILLVPMMLILPRILGLNGVWFAQPIADFISFAVTAVLISREIKSYKLDSNNEVETVSVELQLD